MRGGREGGYDAISLASLSHLDLSLPPGHHGENGGVSRGVEMGGAEGCRCHDGAVLFCRRWGVESVSLGLGMK